MKRHDFNHEISQNKTFCYEKLSSHKKWDDFANKYETSRRLRLIFDRLLDRAELDGKKVLDAGSGGGHFSHAASRLGAKVVSLDVGLNLLKQVGNRCDTRKVVGSVLELPFRNCSFDVVLCTEVIEHTPNPIYATKKLSAVVKPGGLMIITVPCQLWNPIVKVATALKLRPYEGYENFVWPEQLRHALVERGFTIELLTGFNFCPIFSEKIDALFNLFDKVYGKIMPWIMVNIAIRVRRNH